MKYASGTTVENLAPDGHETFVNAQAYSVLRGIIRHDTLSLARLEAKRYLEPNNPMKDVLSEYVLATGANVLTPRANDMMATGVSLACVYTGKGTHPDGMAEVIYMRSNESSTITEMQIVYDIRQCWSPEDFTKFIMESGLFSVLDNDKSMDPFVRSLDAPIVARRLAWAFRKLREGSLPKGEVYVLDSNVQGLPVSVHLAVAGPRQGDELQGTVIRVKYGDVTAYLPYDPGVGYSMARLVRTVQQRILEALHADGNSLFVSSEPLGEGVRSSCVTCGRGRDELVTVDRINVATRARCHSCQKVEDTRKMYQQEDGVIPVV